MGAARILPAGPALARPGLLDICISVNVSAVQFRQTDSWRSLNARSRDRGYRRKPGTGTYRKRGDARGGTDTGEITELDALGVKVAIDDFGTGYSSLSYLRQFTVDRLKIDQSFVRDLPGNIDAEAIAAAIVAMGLSLGLRIIAEGVETEAQAEFLKASYARKARAISMPGLWPPSEFEAWVAAWKLRPAGR